MVTLLEGSGYVPSAPNIRMMPTIRNCDPVAPTDGKNGPWRGHDEYPPAGPDPPTGNAFTRAPDRGDSALGRTCPVTALLDDGMTQDWHGEAGGPARPRLSRARVAAGARPTPARESG